MPNQITAHKASLAIVRKLATQRWGKTACVEERKNAPRPEEREAAFARRKVIVARVAEIDKEAASIAWTAPLLKAARFVVDVGGDEPSIPQLAKALADAERYAALLEERRQLREERDSLNYCHTYRYTAGRITGGFAFCVEFQTDTLEQMYVKLTTPKGGA